MFSEVGFFGCIFLLFVQKEATKPAIAKKEYGINITESTPQEQTNNDNCNVDGPHKNNTSGKLVTINFSQYLNIVWTNVNCVDSTMISTSLKYYFLLS